MALLARDHTIHLEGFLERGGGEGVGNKARKRRSEKEIKEEEGFVNGI
jgi:hypothetical protein